MERNTALGAAAGVVLAVVGAVSALFLTIDRPAEAASTDEPAIEYVDQFGNPTSAPVAAATPDIVLINPDGTLVEQTAGEPAPAYGGEYEDHEEEEGYDEYEDHGEEYDEQEEYEEEDDEDHEEYEDGEEYEDDDQD